MTMPIQFDTLEYARKLTEAGIPPDHADAHAQTLSDVLVNTIVVPGDLILFKAELTSRMDVVQHDLIARIDAVQCDLNARIGAVQRALSARIEIVRLELLGKINSLRWMVGISLATDTLILLKLYFPHTL